MWLDPRFRKQFRPVLSGYDTPLRFSGPRPSFQENLSTVDALRRQLAASNTNPEKNLEKRYPFLDVDFLQFVFALPRDQLLRPGRRRFLMRRALVGVVPEEILNRKRKAYVVRAPRIAIVSHWENLQSLTHNMLAESLGIVSSSLFRQALENIHDGKDLAIVPVQRMLQLESWLRRVSEHGICRSSQLPGSEFANHPPTYAVAKQISAS
jgi:asparagine synthase (glutamine-hydrolysing)